MKSKLHPRSCCALVTGAAAVLSATLLNADVSGTVTDSNGAPFPGIVVIAYDCPKGNVVGWDLTDGAGAYTIATSAQEVRLLIETEDKKCSGEIPCTKLDGKPLDFILKCNKEVKELCWMTGGGVKFESVTRSYNAECDENGGGPKDSVGGNVYPSCSPEPGDGGNWNHVAHSLKLHLLGKDQTVLRCGNVDGIPEGTESPVCGVNFIEWVGTGIVQGIKGNNVGKIPVTYFGRVEDRNEPGNEKALLPDGGDDVDRYFLRVADLEGNVLIQVGDWVDSTSNPNGKFDPDEDTIIPITITGGNFQIHCTSCD